MTQPSKKARESLPAHWQSHQPAQRLRAPGATGLAVEPLVRFGVVWATCVTISASTRALSLAARFGLNAAARWPPARFIFSPANAPRAGIGSL